MAESKQHRVCVVGSGTRFLSGISYYTHRLADTLNQTQEVSVILMRQLIPTRFYPGRDRVGKDLDSISYDGLDVYNGVDWYWFPGIFRAVAFLLRRKPDVMIFQWWSGTVLHTYMLLAILSKLRGTKLIIEFHEVLDTAEARIPLVGPYVKAVMPLLTRMADAFVIHSEFDRPDLEDRYDLRGKPVAVIPHGPYDQYENEAEARNREAPDAVCNILFFGTIRPYKGLEDLVQAFNNFDEDTVQQYWLTVVGESWEGWTLPLELIEQSPYRDRITLVNRYVTDEEVGLFFNGADIVALPYHRSSASGPLHISMHRGLPTIVTRVGGLEEAARDYAGAHFIPAKDPDALQKALVAAAAQRGKRFEDPQSWENTRRLFGELFDKLKKRPEAATAT